MLSSRPDVVHNRCVALLLSRVHLHLLPLYSLHTDVLADFVLGDDLLVQNSRGTPGELVVLKLLTSLVGLDVASVQGGLVWCDDSHIHVGSRSKIVENTGLDRLGAELHGILLSQGRLPLRLEDGHGSQRTGTHGDVRQLVRASVGVDGEEVDSCRVDTSHDQVGADVALVPEEVLLQQGHACDDTRLPARGQRVKLELGGDEGGGELCIGSSTGTGTPNLGCYVVKLLAVLVGNDGTARGSGISSDLADRSVGYLPRTGRKCEEDETYHHTAIVYATDDGSACAGGLGQRDTARMQGCIAVVVGEVEARHDGCFENGSQYDRIAGRHRMRGFISVNVGWMEDRDEANYGCFVDDWVVVEGMPLLVMEAGWLER